MTLEDFEYLIERKSRSGRYFKYSICIVLISVTLYLLISYFTHSMNVQGQMAFILLVSFTVLLNIYSIWEIKNSYKVAVWNNELTKEKNIELTGLLIEDLDKNRKPQAQQHTMLIYKKRWWQLSYSVHLFADNNLIAINADSGSANSGIIDLGSSKRLQNKIIRMLKEKAVTYSTLS